MMRKRMRMRKGKVMMMISIKKQKKSTSKYLMKKVRLGKNPMTKRKKVMRIKQS